MTFFVNEPTEPPKIKANNPDVDIDGGWLGGVGAGITKASLENDANFTARRHTVQAKAASHWDAADRLGLDRISDAARAKGISDASIETFSKFFGRSASHMPPEFQEVIGDMVSLDNENNPETWEDVDLTEEGAIARANEVMQAEHKEATDILDMMPGGQGSAEFVGGMIGISADVKNLPFLVAGAGGGSMARIMGREAAINMAAETAFLPAQYEMAERLDIPDPSVATQLAMAAAGGAAFGGVIEAGARGFAYYRGRNKVSRLPGFDEVASRSLVDQTEDILTSDTPNALEQVYQLHETERVDPPFLLENPINPERPPLIAEPGDLDPSPISTTSLDPVDGGPRDPIPLNDMIESTQIAIDEAKAAEDRSAVRPLTDRLANGHRVTKKAIREAEKAGLPVPKEGTNLQVHPDGMVGQELKSRGITPKTNPRLFSRKGRKDFDDLGAEEWEADFPGIIDATGTARGDAYLDRNGFIDLLARDAEGDASWLATRAEVARLEKQMEDILRDPTAHQQDFETGGKTDGPRGLHFTRDDVEFMEPQDVERAFDVWADERGLTDALTPAERREMIDTLQTSGGDAEKLLGVLWQRELNHAKSGRNTSEPPIQEQKPVDPEPVQRGQGTGRGSDLDARGSGDSAARGSDDGNIPSEATDAGDQLVTPGVEPITPQQRLEAAQNAPLRGGDAAADDGLFDTGARAQTDMFDDPSSPAARVHQDNIIADVKTDIEANGPSEVNLATEDGRVLKTDQDVIDFLDEVETFSNRIDLCGKGPA